MKKNGGHSHDSLMAIYCKLHNVLSLLQVELLCLFFTAMLSLGKNCIYDDQCSLANNVSKCLHHPIKNNKVCSCVRGYVVSGSRCITGTLTWILFCKDLCKIILCIIYSCKMNLLSY